MVLISRSFFSTLQGPLWPFFTSRTQICPLFPVDILDHSFWSMTSSFVWYFSKKYNTGSTQSVLFFELFLLYVRLPLFLPYKACTALWGDLGCISLRSDNTHTIQLLTLGKFFLSCVLSFNQTIRLIFLIWILFLFLFIFMVISLQCCHHRKGEAGHYYY